MNDVDERILSMRFENDDFERGVEETIGTIDKLNRSLANLGGGEANSSINALQSSFDKLNFDSLAQAIDTINYRFSDFGIASARIIEDLADKVFDLGESIVKSLTIDPIAMGWSEYNQLIDISKIIQANTKASMSEINDITDALNTYADKTIYNYANMSSIMQQFIQATGSLETTIQSTGETMSTEKMVEALANYTALTGKGNTELSRVGLQFSRLLMGGDFNKQVMNSLLRNGAAGKIFQETWQRAADNIGMGAQLQAAIEEAGGFMNSFSKQQAKKNFLNNGQNAEILLEFFRILTDPNDPLGRKAIAAAKTPTTFGQVKDQSLEAIQTGWTRIWRTIVGDLEEAKEIWRVVNQHLNETTGVLNKYSEVVGSLFEEWKELGGRTELINGLFDAFQGLYNIVVSLGNIFGQFFPGINSDTLSDFSSGFQEGAENFLSWTEDLRAFFGDFLKGYDFWTEHHVEEIEQEPIVYTPDNDDELAAEYENRVNNWLASYEGLIQNWLNQYMGPEYFKTDKEGNIVFDEKSVNKAIQFLGWESFKDSKDKEGRYLAKQATNLASILVGAADDTGFNRGLHIGGIMSDEYYDQYGYDEIERELKLSVLRENGINTYKALEDIKDQLKRYEEQPPQINEWDDHGAHALLRKGIELNDETAILYRHQLNFINAFEGFAKLIHYITSSVKTIYKYLVKPLVSSVFVRAVTTISDVLGGLGARLSSFIDVISNGDPLKNFATKIYRIFAVNTDLYAFFDDVTNAVLTFNDVIWDAAEGLVTLFDSMMDSKPIRTIKGAFSVLWGVIEPFISNNSKSGMAVGGIIGAVINGVKGFFKGGPFGLITGALKGFAGGALKGKFFGTILDVFNYLINNKERIIGLFQEIGTRISVLFESFKTGFTSKYNPIMFIANGVIALARGLHDLFTGKIDPITQLTNFVKGDAFTGFIEKLKAPFVTFGGWISGIWDFIYTNVSTFFKNIGLKWQTYMEKNNNNPFEAFANMFKDSNLYKILSTIGGIFKDLFDAIKTGFLGVKDTVKNSKLFDSKTFKNLPLVTQIQLKIEDFRKSLEDFRKGDTFKGIKDFFSGIGEGIHEAWKAITSGDVLGIIVNFFTTIGSLFKSFFDGIFGVEVSAAEMDETVEAIAPKSLSERLSSMKTAFDDFLGSDSFASMQSRFNGFGQFLTTTVLPILKDVGDKILWVLHLFTPAKINGIYVGKSPVLTVDGIIDDVKQLGSILGGIFKSFYEGFSGKEFTDDATGIIASLNQMIFDLGESLKNFSTSESFGQVKDFANWLGGEFRDKVDWIWDKLTKLPELLTAISNPVGSITGALGDLSGTAEAVTESLSGIGDGKNDGIFGGLINKAVGLFDFLTGTQTLTKEVASAVANSRDSNWETHSVTATLDGAQNMVEAVGEIEETAKDVNPEKTGGILKGITDMIFGYTVYGANEINDGAEPVEDADKNVKPYTKFLSNLGTAAKVIAGIAAVVLAGTLLSTLTGLGALLRGLFGLAGVVSGFSGILKAEMFLKYAKTIGIIALAVVGVALVFDGLKNKWSLLVGIGAVLAILLVALKAMNHFAKESQGTLTNAPFDAIKTVAASIADGIKDLFDSIKQLLMIGGIVAVLVVVSAALYKLASLPLDNIKAASEALTGIIIAVIAIVAATYFASKFIGPDTLGKMTMLGIVFGGIGVGVGLIGLAIADLVKICDEVFKDKTLKQGAAIVAGVFGIVLGIVLALAAGTLLLAGLSKFTTALDVPEIISMAVAILMLGVATKMIINSTVNLIEAVDKAKNLDILKLLGIAVIVGAIIVALGGFIALAGSKNKTITIRSAASLIVLAAAVGMILLAVGLFTSYLNAYFASENNNVISKKGAILLVSLLAIVGIIAALALAINLMSGDAVALRSSMAMIALVLSVGVLLIELGSLINIISNLPGKNVEEKSATFEKAILSICGLIGTLVLAMTVLKLKEISFGKFSVKGNTGFATVIAMLVMIGAVMASFAILDGIKDDTSKYEEAIANFTNIIGVLVIAMVALNWLANDIKMGTIGVLLLLIVGISAAIAAMDYFIEDSAKLKQIGETFALVVGVVGGITALIGAVSALPMNELNVADMILTMLAMIVTSALALVLVANNLKEPDKLMDVAEALSLFVGAIAGISVVFALVGTFIAPMSAGLASLGLVGTIISAIIAVIAGIYGAFKDNPVIKKISESLEKGFTDFASFIGKFVGELVKAFNETSMVDNADAITKQTDAISKGVQNISDSAANIDFEGIDKVQDVLLKFSELGNALALIMASESGFSNIYTMFGNDIGNFGPKFREFAESVMGLSGEVDLELVQLVCSAFEEIAKTEVPTEGFIFKKPIDFTVFGENMSALSGAINSLYEMCANVTDTNIVTNITTLLDNIWEFIEKAKEYKTVETIFADFTDVLNSIASFGIDTKNFGLTKSVNETSVNNLDKFVELLKYMSEVANLSFEDNGDVSDFVKGILLAFSGESESLTNVGTGIAAIIMSGFKSFMDTDRFSDAVGYVVKGLTVVLSEKYKEEIVEAGFNLASTLEQAFRDAMGIESPSTVMMGLGIYIIQGLIEGMEKQENPLIQKITSICKNITDAFKNNIKFEGPVADELKAGFDSFTKGVSGFIADPMSIFDSKKGKKNKKTHSTVPGSVQRTYYGKRDKAIIDTNKNIEEAIKEATDATTGELDYDKFVDSIISSAMGEDFGKLVEEAQENGNYLGVLTGAIDLLKENNKELDKKILKNGADQETLENKSILEGVIDYLTGNLKNEEKETYSVIEAFNGWVDENVVDPVKQYAKDKLSDNELLSLILNGLEDREEGESILDYLKRKGIKISETQLKRVMEGDFFKTLISELGLGEITENTEVWSEWLSESGGDINKLIEIIQKSVPGLNLSESDLANKITTMFDFMNASGFDMFDEKSGLYDSLKKFIPDDMFGDMLGDMGLDSLGLDSLGDAGSSLGDAFGKTFEQSTEQAVDQVDQRITDMAMRVIRGDFGNNPDRQRILESMGYSFGVIQNEVNRLLGCNYRYAVSNEDVKRTIEALGGSVDDTSQKIANSAVQTTGATDEYIKALNEVNSHITRPGKSIEEHYLREYNRMPTKADLDEILYSNKIWTEELGDLRSKMELDGGYALDLGIQKYLLNIIDLSSSREDFLAKMAADKDNWTKETYNNLPELYDRYTAYKAKIASNPVEVTYKTDIDNELIDATSEINDSTNELDKSTKNIKDSTEELTDSLAEYNNATYSISDSVLESTGLTREEAEEAMNKFNETANGPVGTYLLDMIKEFGIDAVNQEGLDLLNKLHTELRNSTSLEDFKKALTENVEVFGEDTIEKAEKIWDSYQNYIKAVAKETVIVYEDNASNLYNYDQMKENADNYVEILEDENNKIVEVLETGNEKISDASDKINKTIYKYRSDGNRAINYKTYGLNFSAMAEVMDDIDLNDAEKAKNTIDTYRKTYQDLVELKNRQGERLLPEKVEKDIETAKELNSIIKQYKDNYSKGLVKTEGPHGGYGLDGMTTDMANRLLTRDLNDYLMNHAQDYTDVTNDLTVALAAIKDGDYDKTIESLDKAYGNLNETVGKSDIKVKQGFANAIKYLEEGNQEKASLHLNNVATELRQAASYQEEVNKELIANENAYRNIATVLLNPNAHFKYDETTIPKLLDDMNSWAISSIGKETGNIPQDSYSELAFAALRQKLEQMGLGFTEEFNNLGEIIGMSIFGELGNNLFDVTYQNGKLIAKSFEEGVQRELLDQSFEDSIGILNRRLENTSVKTLENMERHIKEINDGLTDDSKLKLLGKQLDEAGNISEIFLGSVDGEKTYRLFYENGKVIGEYLAEGIKSGTTTHTQTFEESVDQLQRRIANSSKQSIEDVGRFISDINKTLDEESQLKILDKTADQSGQIFRMLIGDANGEKMISVASENGQLVARNFVKGFVDESLAYMAEETPKTVEELSAYIDKMLQADSKNGLLSQSMQKISNIAKEVDGVDNVIETFDSLGNLIEVSLYDATGEKIQSYVYDNGNIIGTNIVTGVIDGVDDKKDDLMTTMNKLTSDYIINPVKTVLDSHSPSVVFVGIGEDAIRGFIDGANTMAEPLYDTLKTMMTNAMYMAAQVWQASEIAADDNFQFTPSITPVVDTSKSNGLGELLTNGGPMSVNIATTPGFERIMSISDMFERRLNQDAVIIDSMAAMHTSINELNRTNEATNTAIGGLRKDVNSLNASMANLKVVLNDDTLVGKITPSINRELGKIQTRRERSV